VSWGRSEVRSDGTGTTRANLDSPDDVRAGAPGPSPRSGPVDAGRGATAARTAVARWYLISRTLGIGGDSLVVTLLPLLTVLLFGGGPGEVAAVLLVRQVVNFLGSFPLAVWLDRAGDRAEVQIVALLGSAAITATVSVLWAVDALTYPLLLVAALLFFVCNTVVTTSGYGLVSQLTSPGARVAYTGQMASSRAVAEVSGQAAGPALLRFVPGPVAVLAGGTLAVVSALILVPVRRRLLADDARAAATDTDPEVVEAGHSSRLRIATQIRDTLASLRAVTVVAARQPDLVVLWAAAAGASITAPILIVYAVNDLGVSAETFGLLTAAGAAGGVLGGLVAGRVSSWLEPLLLMGAGSLVAAAAVPVLALGELFPNVRALAYAGVSGYEFITTVAGAIMLSVVFGRLQETSALSELAQTMSVARLGMDAAIIAALVAGGWLGSSVGPPAVLMTAAAILVLSAVGAFVVSAHSPAEGD
jgi:hypothetical protein